MSIEKINKRKEYKKNKKQIWKKEKRKQRVESAVCIFLSCIMLASPILMSVYFKANKNTVAIASDSDAAVLNYSPVLDDSGNEIGHMHEDGEIHLDTETE